MTGLPHAARQIIAAWDSGQADWDSAGPGSLTAAVRSLHAALAVPHAVLTEAQRDVLLRMASDAITYRMRGVGSSCADCEDAAAGLCQDHVDDLDQADEYRQLCADLGVEVPE